MEWQTVIGMEIHVQLATKSKMFSASATTYGAAPNEQASAIDLGLPGVLPVINSQAVSMAIKFGLAIEADIPGLSIFARKNYLYPDLPKGYQISQFEFPIVGQGHVDIQLQDGSTKNIGIIRAHLEEDAGKSIHDGFGDYTGIDFNRAGTPLLEVVSEPDMYHASEAVAYMKKIHSIVRYLEICDGNMQEGSFRCDANVSVRPKGTKELGTRTELKNINSFRFIEQAIHLETERQIDILENGGMVMQETRLYDPGKNETRPMRSKEEADDYRYFPDPDLPPIKMEKSLIDTIKSTLPELPDAKKKRFIKVYQLTEHDAMQLTAQKEMADYFEDCVSKAGGEAKMCANWINGEMTAKLNRDNRDISANPVSAAMLADMLMRIKDNTISSKIAKQVFDAMWNGEGHADHIIANKGLKQIINADIIDKLVTDTIDNNPDQVKLYRNSSPEKRDKLIGYFVGQVMKQSSGKANPKKVRALLAQKLTA